MHSLGHDFVPPPIHAGGLRYHGIAPLISAPSWKACHPEAVPQLECYASAVQFARPKDSSWPPRPATPWQRPSRRPGRPRRKGKEKVIVFQPERPWPDGPARLQLYFHDKLQDYALPKEDIDRALQAHQASPQAALLASGRRVLSEGIEAHDREQGYCRKLGITSTSATAAACESGAACALPRDCWFESFPSPSSWLPTIRRRSWRARARRPPSKLASLLAAATRARG